MASAKEILVAAGVETFGCEAMAKRGGMEPPSTSFVRDEEDGGSVGSFSIRWKEREEICEECGGL